MLFSDDELVAMAIAVGQGWSGRLATVDDGDAEALLACVRRGRVTLTARGLVGAEGAENPLVAAVLEAVGLRPVVRAHLALEAHADTAVGLATEIYRLADGRFLIDVSRPDGLHEIDLADAVRIRAFIDRAVDMALEDGVGVENLRLAVIASAGDDHQVQLVDRARVCRRRIDPASDRGTIAEAVESATLDHSVIDRLLAAS